MEHQVKEPMVAGSAQMMILRTLGISATEAIKRLNADSLVSDAEARSLQNIVAADDTTVINAIIHLEQSGRMRFAIEAFRKIVGKAVARRQKAKEGTAAAEGGSTSQAGAAAGAGAGPSAHVGGAPLLNENIAIHSVAGGLSPGGGGVIVSAANAALSPSSVGSGRSRVSTVDEQQSVEQDPSVVNTIPVAPGRHVHKVLVKIGRRLEALGNTGRKSIVIVGSGAYNPVTTMHLRMFYLARQFLEENTDFQVIGGLMSPSHCTYVRQKTRRTPREIIPPRHRLCMARLGVKQSSWMSVDPWEITRRRVMDYVSVLDHTSEILRDSFPNVDFRVVYLCGASHMVKLNPPALREAGYGCLCVCRPLESERLLRQLGSRWNGVANIVEDTAMLSRELEATSSSRVREHLMKDKPVHGMVGHVVSKHLLDHHIGEKLTGHIKWNERDRAFQWDDTPDPDDRYRPYMREPKKIIRPETDLPLQI